MQPGPPRRPLYLARQEVNHSRWEDQFKWDSYGAPFVLDHLASGRLPDEGRRPLVTLLAGVAARVNRSRRWQAAEAGKELYEKIKPLRKSA